MILNYVADLGIRLASFGRGGESKGQIKWQKERSRQTDRKEGRQAGKQAGEGWMDGWIDEWMEKQLCGHDVDGLPTFIHPGSPHPFVSFLTEPATCPLPEADDCRCYKYRPLACASTYPTTPIISLNTAFSVTCYLYLHTILYVNVYCTVSIFFY